MPATSAQFKGVCESLDRFLKVGISIHTEETPKRSGSFNAGVFEFKSKKSGTYVMSDKLLN